MARWENENWIVKHPEEDKVVCKDCVFRSEDQVYNGKIVTKGACLGICQVFPNNKPAAILFDDAECEYYVSEKD